MLVLLVLMPFDKILALVKIWNPGQCREGTSSKPLKGYTVQVRKLVGGFISWWTWSLFFSMASSLRAWSG